MVLLHFALHLAVSLRLQWQQCNATHHFSAICRTGRRTNPASRTPFYKKEAGLLVFFADLILCFYHWISLGNQFVSFLSF